MSFESWKELFLGLFDQWQDIFVSGPTLDKKISGFSGNTGVYGSEE
jgi:hypothetical protein